MVSLGYRNRAIDAVAFTAESDIGVGNGDCNILLEARYIKARLRHPAGSTWTYARAMQPEAQLAGDY